MESLKALPEHYILLANLFDYPKETYLSQVNQVQNFLEANHPEAGETLRDFTTMLGELSRSELEELFIRAYDVQAVTTLDVGYVLFGEDYKRGELLANLNREHVEAENDCGNELADHLPNILRLIPKMKDVAIANEFVEKILVPALRKMINEFDVRSLEAKKKEYTKHYKTFLDKPVEHLKNFQRPLLALYQIMQNDFSILDTEHPEFQSDFLKSIQTEISVEENQT